MATNPMRPQTESERFRADDSHRNPRKPAREDIARRAYDLYEKRGGEPGHDMDDWLQAERDLEHAR